MLVWKFCHWSSGDCCVPEYVFGGSAITKANRAFFGVSMQAIKSHRESGVKIKISKRLTQHDRALWLSEILLAAICFTS